MQVVTGLGALPNGHVPGYVVVGAFDGLHRGHEYLLRHLVAVARRRGARPVVITFDHHPDEIITGTAPPLLCDPDERLVRMARAGVDAVVVVHFDARLRETTFQDFVAMVGDRMPLAGFLMTPDAAFGYRRRGTPEALAELGARAGAGFEVTVVPPFALGDRQVRSTDIRAAIASAHLPQARRLLGRPHAVVGTPGARVGQGSVLAFPLPVALPPDGDYPVAVEPAWHMGVARGPVRPRAASVRDGRLVVRGRVPADGPVRVSFRTPRDRWAPAGWPSPPPAVHTLPGSAYEPAGCPVLASAAVPRLPESPRGWYPPPVIDVGIGNTAVRVGGSSAARAGIEAGGHRVVRRQGR